MRQRYLEVTFRQGKALSAYLYLPRESGVKAVRTEACGNGLFVDYDARGSAMGLEITAPSAVTLDDVNRVLEGLGQPALTPGEWAPATAA
jgi:uncharacterized protein YuzE